MVGETVTGKRLATVAPPAGPRSPESPARPTIAPSWWTPSPAASTRRASPGSRGPGTCSGSIPVRRSPARLTPLPVPGTARHQRDGDRALPGWHRTRRRTAAGRPERPERADLPAGLLGRQRGGAALVVLDRHHGPLREPRLFAGTKYAGPDSNLALAWVGQRGLAFGYSRVIPAKTADGSQVTSQKVTLAQIRFISLQARNGGDLITAGTGAGVPGARPARGAGPAGLRPGTLNGILVTERGTTADADLRRDRRHLLPRRRIPRRTCSSEPVFRLGLVEYAAGASAPSRVLARYATSCVGPLVTLQPLWSNPTGTTQLGLLGLRKDTARRPPSSASSARGDSQRCRCRRPLTAAPTTPLRSTTSPGSTGEPTDRPAV